MAGKRNDLFKRAEAELHVLGGEISKRKSADAAGASLTADMRAASAMLRAGVECHGREAQELSLKMLDAALDAATRQRQGAGRMGLELRERADRMVQTVLDAESAVR
jgi:hypothetical protein